MLKHAYGKIRNAVLLANIGGLMAFFTEFINRIYSTATYMGLEKNLVTNGAQVQCPIEYSLRQAAEQDMSIVLQQSREESKKSVYEVIKRKWFYEAGFHGCYVAKTNNTGEICYMAWLISSANSNNSPRKIRIKLPPMKKDEILLENSYTFEKFRGNRIMSSAIIRLAELARRNGFKRMITYVRQDNVASLKGCERAGFHPSCKEIFELKLLFFTKRNYKQRAVAAEYPSYQ